MRMKPCSGRLLAASSVFLLTLTFARADDPPGVLWETTSQMVMEGMPMAMPPQTVKVCTAKEWRKPPPGGDPTCVHSNFQRDGNKATWSMQCSGEMPMQGTGEITFDGSDSYTGVIKATAQGMAMTIKLSGKKLGTCDKPVD
jgi:Protein of unknown function (DUF3617)